MPVALPMIAVLVILNDVVTITLATDRAELARQPERWNLQQVARYGGGLAVAWLALGLLLLWVASHRLGLAPEAVQSLMFAYLIYSAQATIYLTRVRGRCWSSRPSALVAAATGGNTLLATAMAGFGLLTPAVPWAVLAATLLGVGLVTLVLDLAKPWLSHARQ
jgi:H+-transporting ATPase